MNRESSGIILLSANGVRKKTSILDRSLGRIEAIMSREISAGTIISYRLSPFTSGYFLSEVKIEYVPLFLAAHDLLFLHHMLELCYYFIPVGSCIAGLFDVIHWIYKLGNEVHNPLLKKYSIAKLLTTLGLWPEQHNVNTRMICQLINIPIDRITLQDVNLANERELNQWLRFCILQHPSGRKLQTIAFLSQGTKE